jgi:hypothetical protein
LKSRNVVIKADAERKKRKEKRKEKKEKKEKMKKELSASVVADVVHSQRARILDIKRREGRDPLLEGVGWPVVFIQCSGAAS